MFRVSFGGNEANLNIKKKLQALFTARSSVTSPLSLCVEGAMNVLCTCAFKGYRNLRCARCIDSPAYTLRPTAWVGAKSRLACKCSHEECGGRLQQA
eukprot:5223409-Amphidinium_carterae.1